MCLHDSPRKPLGYAGFIGGYQSVSDVSDWKSSFYKAYVSSGQAMSKGATASEVFRTRIGYANYVIAKHLPQDRTVRVADLACGSGHWLYALELAGYRNVAGIDVSEEQISEAHRLGITSATCSTLEAYLESQGEESIDVVLAIDIFEHMTRGELMNILHSIRRVLKPGGRCIAHVPNAEGIFGMQVRFGDFTHELAFTKRSASQIFRVAGFRQVQCFEDKPLVRGIKSFVRRVIWDVFTIPRRLLLLAEVGVPGAILSRNMVIEAHL
jgi:2-polyprenyl-3-methyl-5-hydroxy-6-metoxy-1,4-benzoquinol methylase